MSKIRILIADDIKETRELIKKCLMIKKEYFEVVGEAQNGEEVIEFLEKQQTDIVLMDINMPVMNGLKATEVISEQFPSVIVIIMSVQSESEYLKRAMFAGAKEFIIKPFNMNILIDTINATYTKNKVVKKAETKEESSNKKAEVLTFYSSKGGVGKSILAVNSAITLSNTFNKKTLLIDLDLQFGDISMLINRPLEKTIIDLIDDGKLNSYENMKEYFCEYDENLDILLAPRKPENAEYINQELLEKMLKILVSEYDYIIVDTGVNFSDETLYVLDISKYILFITTMDIISLKNSKLGLGVMSTLNYDKEKVKLVVNCATTKFGIRDYDVKSVFKEDVFKIISEDRKIAITSVNNGIPFCDNSKHKNSKIVKAVSAMCKELIS